MLAAPNAEAGKFQRSKKDSTEEREGQRKREEELRCLVYLAREMDKKQLTF